MRNFFSYVIGAALLGLAAWSGQGHAEEAICRPQAEKREALSKALAAHSDGIAEIQSVRGKARWQPPVPFASIEELEQAVQRFLARVDAAR